MAQLVSQISTISIMVTIIGATIEIMATIISLQVGIGQYTARFVNNGTLGLVHLGTDAIGRMCVGHVLRQER